MLRAVELEFIDKGRPVFDLDDLLMASAELMGKGKVGSTYKATLESGSVVAVKRLKEMNGLRKKEFVQQLMLLGKMRHENLVEIISFYYTKEEKLIVYEYVPHGSLFEHLHGKPPHSSSSPPRNSHHVCSAFLGEGNNYLNHFREVQDHIP